MPKPTPVKRKPGRTRRRLLEAAIQLFSDQGYHAVSVDEIVATAGANKRMVYHYFGSKEALFQAALHAVYSQLETVEIHSVERGSNPRDKLMRLIEAYFDFLEKNPPFVRLLLWENLESGRHIAKQAYRLTKDPFLERFRQIVEDGIASGQFRPELKVKQLLIHFIGLCFIYQSNRYSLSQGLGINLSDPKIRAEGLDQVLQLVFDGICTHAAPGERERGRAKPAEPAKDRPRTPLTQR